MSDLSLSISVKIRFPSPIRALQKIQSDRNKEIFNSYSPSYVRTISESNSVNDNISIDSRPFPSPRNPRSIRSVFSNHSQRSPNFRRRSNMDSPGPGFRRVNPQSCRPSFFSIAHAKKVHVRTGNKILLKSAIKIFLGEELEEEDLGDSHFKYNLLRQYIVKKFKKIDLREADSLNYDNKFKEEAIKRINSKIKIGSHKRSEEKNKFVFKSVLKDLKKKYQEEHEIKNEIESEKSFYQFYFSEKARKEGIHINSFYDPLYNIKMKNKSFKTINICYLKLVFTNNEEFLKVFRESLKDLKQRSIDSISGTIEKSLESIKQALFNEDFKEEDEEKIYIDFTTSFAAKAKFKLPWTEKEIDDAIAYFNGLLNGIVKV